MRIKTAEIPISKSLQGSIIENWNTSKSEEVNQETIDGELISQVRQFNIVLRIPYVFKGSKNHILLNSHLAFRNNIDGVILSLYCSILKPAILFIFLGLLTATIFVLPKVYSNNGSVLMYVFSVLVLSAVYFVFFYFRLLRISNRYLTELSQKHL